VKSRRGAGEKIGLFPAEAPLASRLNTLTGQLQALLSTGKLLSNLQRSAPKFSMEASTQGRQALALLPEEGGSSVSLPSHSGLGMTRPSRTALASPPSKARLRGVTNFTPALRKIT
jgi:hypothetical protein